MPTKAEYWTSLCTGGLTASALTSFGVNVPSWGKKKKTHLKGTEPAQADPQGFCLSNYGTDTTPDKAVTTNG